jgi:hypothetical protein
MRQGWHFGLLLMGWQGREQDISHRHQGVESRWHFGGVFASKLMGRPSRHQLEYERKSPEAAGPGLQQTPVQVFRDSDGVFIMESEHVKSHADPSFTVESF